MYTFIEIYVGYWTAYRQTGFDLIHH